MKKHIPFIVSLFSFMVLISCQMGLGGAIDLYGPTVTVTSPEETAHITGLFEAAGSITDDFGVATLTVRCDENEYKNENGKWLYKLAGQTSFLEYPADAEHSATWHVDAEGKVTWSITGLSVQNSGLQTIEFTSVDTSGNTTALSKVTVPVYVDLDPPVVTINTPVLMSKTTLLATFNGKSTYKENRLVKQLQSESFTFTGNTEEENEITYLAVVLTEVGDDGSVMTVNETPVFREIFLPDSASLLAWSVPIDASKLASSGKHYYKVTTISDDNAGNNGSRIEEEKGYICWWPEADKPWVSINSSKISEDENLPKDTYAGNTLAVDAYDNNQVASVKLTVTKKDGASWKATEVTDKELVTSASQKQTLQIECPSEIGVFKLELKASDDKGVPSDTFTGYIKILDENAPSISASVSQNAPFGDNDGTVTFTVTAKDNTSIHSIKFFHVTDSAQKATYGKKDNAVWNGNTVKSLTVPAEYTNETVNGVTRKVYTGTYTMNLFTDFGINGTDTKLIAQQFYFWTEDDQGNCALYALKMEGDTTAPSLAFTATSDGFDATTNSRLPVFTEDFVVSGTWNDDSYEAWKGGAGNKCSLTVSVNGNAVDSSKITMNGDGRWTATVDKTYTQDNSNNPVSAFDIVAVITDIAGNTFTLQKGYRVDTNEPRLDFISCDKPSGTYVSADGMTISLHFNRALTVLPVSELEVPVLTLSNGKKARYSSGSGTKVLDFIYDASGEDPEDTNGGNLSVASIDVNDCSFTVTNEILGYTKLGEEITTAAFNKDIVILTTVPQYRSHSWNDATGALTLVFDGLVTANTGSITITQNEESLLVPAYLTKDEYNNLNMTDKATYYREGTLGADSKYESDLSTKYILDYQFDTNTEAVKNAYIATGAHKTTVNIKSNKVSRSENKTDNTTTFTITFGALPVKGATYSFEIPEGLVQNAAGTKNAEVTKNDQNEKLTVTTSGVESPVIRVYKPQQSITGCSTTSAGTVTHPLSTTFKVDCRTPGATLTYSYTCDVPDSALTVEVDNKKNNNDPLSYHCKFTFNGKTTSTNAKQHKPTITFRRNANYAGSGTFSGTPVALGKSGDTDIPYSQGLTYNISATATKTGEPPKTTYEVAYRTTIVIKDGSKINALKTGGGYTLFLRGGDNFEGANATSGLPASWNINNPGDIIMLKADGDDYYFTTWNISTSTFYFQLLNGKCDDKTNTANGNQGPAEAIYLQEGLVWTLPEYPVGKGECLIWSNSGRFDYGVAGKVMHFR